MTILDHVDLEMLGIKFSTSTLRRLERAGKFPRRVRLSRYRIGWPADEIHDYLANLITSRVAA